MGDSHLLVVGLNDTSSEYDAFCGGTCLRVQKIYDGFGQFALPVQLITQ
jgi:hypothetical protein